MIRIGIVSEYNSKGQKQAQQGIQTLDKQIKELGKAAIKGFALEQLYSFGKAAVNAASDLAESANAVAVTFGDATDSINQLAEDAVDAYGMSTTEFNQFATQFSGFAMQIAGDGGDISKVIDDMGTRIADFASVHNLSLQEAGSKFQSAMAGSSEVVRQYGIDLSAATVEQYALERGLASSKSEIDETVKVQARYELLLQSTTKWAGDFANTSDSLANSQRRLQARLSDLQAELGSYLLPVVEETTANVLFLVEGISSLADAAEGTEFPLAGLIEQVRWMGDGFFLFNKGISFLRGEMEDTTTAIEMQTRTYWNLRYAASQTTPEVADNSEAMRDAAWAARWQTSEIAELRTALQKLRGELDDRQSWRNLYKDVTNVRDVTKEFGVSSREADEALDDLSGTAADYVELLDVPAEVKTDMLLDIQALVEAQDVDALVAKVLRLEGGITVPIQPQLIGGTGLQFDEFGNVGLAGRGATPTPAPNVNVVAAGLDAYSIARALERESISSGALPINTTTAVSPS